jgi:uncharacterized protein (TIGR02300 family)
MAKAELGLKRRCLSCNTPFFDLNRVPIVCPKCAAAFQVVEIAHSAARRTPFRPVPIERFAPVEPIATDMVLLVDDEDGVESASLPTEKDDETQESEAATCLNESDDVRI